MGKQSTIENGQTREAIVTKGDNLTVKKWDLMTGETYSLVWGKEKERTQLVRLTKILFMDSFDKIRKGQRERERDCNLEMHYSLQQSGDEQDYLDVY